MNSMQSKCFNKLAAEYFVSSGCGFSFDPLIKKAAPLVTKKLAYSSTDFHGICSIFLSPRMAERPPDITHLLLGVKILKKSLMQ